MWKMRTHLGTQRHIVQVKVVCVDHALRRRVNAARHGDAYRSGRFIEPRLFAERMRHLCDRFGKRARMRLLLKGLRHPRHDRKGIIHNACGDVRSADIKSDPVHTFVPFCRLSLYRSNVSRVFR